MPERGAQCNLLIKQPEMDNCLPTLSWIILSVRTETNFGSETHKITSPEELLTIFKAAGLWKNVKEIEILYNTRYNNIDLKTAKLRSIERLICRVYRKHYFGLWLPNLCLMPATVVSEKKVLFIVYLSKRWRRGRDDKQILYPSATKRTELEYWKVSRSTAYMENYSLYLYIYKLFG